MYDFIVEQTCKSNMNHWSTDFIYLDEEYEVSQVSW